MEKGKRSFGNTDVIRSRLRELRHGETLAVWYDGAMLYPDEDAPLTATWIADFAAGDTLEFVLDIVDAVMNDLERAL